MGTARCSAPGVLQLAQSPARTPVEWWVGGRRSRQQHVDQQLQFWGSEADKSGGQECRVGAWRGGRRGSQTRESQRRMEGERSGVWGSKGGCVEVVLAVVEEVVVVERGDGDCDCDQLRQLDL